MGDSKPLGCWAWGGIITGALFLLGWIPAQMIAHQEAKERAEVQGQIEKKAAELKAIPPSDHLKWGRQEIAALEKTWNGTRFDQFIDRMMVIDKNAPERPEANKLIQKGWSLQKAENARYEKQRRVDEVRLAKEQEPLRRAYAQQLEESLLERRMNADVTTGGPGYTTITIKWALVNKVTAHDIEKNTDLHNKLRELHFKKLVITDGYKESWYWTY